MKNGLYQTNISEYIHFNYINEEIISTYPGLSPPYRCRAGSSQSRSSLAQFARCPSEKKQPHGVTKRAGNTRTEPGERETSGSTTAVISFSKERKDRRLAVHTHARAHTHTHTHTHCADRRTEERTVPLRRRTAVELKGMRKNEQPRSSRLSQSPIKELRDQPITDQPGVYSNQG